MKSKLVYKILLVISLIIYVIPAWSQSKWTGKYSAPSSFVQNVGQFKSPDGQKVYFAYDDGDYRILFTAEGLVYTFSVKKEADREPDTNYPEKENENKRKKISTEQVTMLWENSASNSHLLANEITNDYFSYVYVDGGKERNNSHVNAYKKLLYKNIYEGIDIEYTTHSEGGIKYSLIVHPGADVSKIRMKYSKNVSIENNQININTVFGNIIDHRPLTFYASNSNSIINSDYVLLNQKTVGFLLDAYNKNETVVIDPWTQNPVINNSRKIWETETDVNGNVYIYAGDSPVRLLKYNSAGTLQWTYTSVIDTANFWLGGFVTNQNTGESYITSGSVGRIWKISTAGALVWTNNPNGFNSFEYWSLSFNCDMTKLAIGGSSGVFSIRGYVFNINLATGAQAGSRIIGYGSMGFPPNMQEASSITWGPYSNYYFLTLDTIGAVSDAMTTVNFKTATGYLFDYYIPNFGLGTKQPICATRANTIALYTVNGTTVHKRDLVSGAVLASAVIPGGSAATSFFGGKKLPNNAGVDIDNCGNVYVGSTNQLVKYDQNLVQLATVATSFPIYDVDVNNNGEVIACGFSGGNGYVQSIAIAACAQVTPVCISILPVSISSFQVLCENNLARIEWTTESEKNNSYFTVMRSADGINFEPIKKIAGMGNSEVRKNYFMVDSIPLPGTSYYKLTQTDFEGQTNSNNMADFTRTCQNGEVNVNVYPNPFNSNLNFELNLTKSSEVTIELYNYMGVKIKEIFSSSILNEGVNTIEMETQDILPSIYFVKTSINDNHTVTKIIKR